MAWDGAVLRGGAKLPEDYTRQLQEAQSCDCGVAG